MTAPKLKDWKGKLSDRAYDRFKLLKSIDAAPNKRAACKEADLAPSAFYAWRARVVRRDGLWDPARLEPQSRKPLTSPNKLKPRTVRQIVTLALKHPGMGCKKLGLTLPGQIVSEPTVRKYLKSAGLLQAPDRYAALARGEGYAKRPSAEQRKFMNRRKARADCDVVTLGMPRSRLHVGRVSLGHVPIGRASKRMPTELSVAFAIDVVTGKFLIELLPASLNNRHLDASLKTAVDAFAGARPARAAHIQTSAERALIRRLSGWLANDSSSVIDPPAAGPGHRIAYNMLESNLPRSIRSKTFNSVRDLRQHLVAWEADFNKRILRRLRAVGRVT